MNDEVSTKLYKEQEEEVDHNICDEDGEGLLDTGSEQENINVPESVNDKTEVLANEKKEQGVEVDPSVRDEDGDSRTDSNPEANSFVVCAQDGLFSHRKSSMVLFLQYDHLWPGDLGVPTGKKSVIDDNEQRPAFVFVIDLTLCEEKAVLKKAVMGAIQNIPENEEQTAEIGLIFYDRFLATICYSDGGRLFFSKTQALRFLERFFLVCGKGDVYFEKNYQKSANALSLAMCSLIDYGYDGNIIMLVNKVPLTYPKEISLIENIFIKVFTLRQSVSGAESSDNHAAASSLSQQVVTLSDFEEVLEQCVQTTLKSVETTFTLSNSLELTGMSDNGWQFTSLVQGDQPLTKFKFYKDSVHHGERMRLTLRTRHDLFPGMIQTCAITCTYRDIHGRIRQRSEEFHWMVKQAPIANPYAIQLLLNENTYRLPSEERHNMPAIGH